MRGTRGTIVSRGCFDVNSAVGKSFTRPILAFTPERFEALAEAHLPTAQSPRTAHGGSYRAAAGSGCRAAPWWGGARRGSSRSGSP